MAHMQTLQKWIIVDWTDEEKELLKEMAWEWMDAYDVKNEHPLGYGYYWTENRNLAEETAKLFNIYFPE